MEYKKVCFMYRNKDYAVDGMRSALGLAVENMYSYGVVMDTEIDKLDEHNLESIEMLRDMEGEIYSRFPPMSRKTVLRQSTWKNLAKSSGIWILSSLTDLNRGGIMKILNVYRSEPDETVKKLVEIVTRDRESDSFDLNVASPDYDALVDKIFDADQTICWW